MPDKPLWLDRLPQAIRQLEANLEPWVDRPTLETLLGVGRRRAQQLLAPVASRRVGTSLVADRGALITYLKKINDGEDAYNEQQRQKQLWTRLKQVRREWVRQPPVLVEVSQAQIRRVELHDFNGLPAGVELAPGSIVLRFDQPEEALQKLLALAIAISKNQQAFEDRVSSR